MVAVIVAKHFLNRGHVVRDTYVPIMNAVNSHHGDQTKHLSVLRSNSFLYGCLIFKANLHFESASLTICDVDMFLYGGCANFCGDRTLLREYPAEVKFIRVGYSVGG